MLEPRSAFLRMVAFVLVLMPAAATARERHTVPSDPSPNAYAPAPSSPAPVALAGLMPTIAALLAQGDTSRGAIYVQNYAKPNDGGGGIFVWDAASTAAPDRCLTFAGNGAAPGRWVRQLNGTPFNADMCGTGTPNDAPAIQAAFDICSAQHMHLSFAARRYLIGATLNAPTTCAWDGAFGAGFPKTLPTVFDYSRSSGVTQAINVVGGAPGTYGNAAPFGHFSIWGYRSSLTRGLYITRTSGLHVTDVAVLFVSGPCIYVGQIQEATFERIYGTACGGPDSGEIEFDGSDWDGRGVSSTTTTAIGIYAENDTGMHAQCGIKIDDNLAFAIVGGSSEANGTPLCLNTKPTARYGDGSVSVSDFDMENPGNGATHCVIVGKGWSGKPGLGNVNIAFRNTVCQAGTQARLTSAFLVSNSVNFLAQNNYAQFIDGGVGAVDFAFEGVNSGAILLANTGTAGERFEYVSVDGVVQHGAAPDTPWYMSSLPTKVAQLPLCNGSYLGVARTVTDGRPGANAVVAGGGGGGATAVTCDGKAWRVGGRSPRRP
jgi:hypothetical protein